MNPFSLIFVEVFYRPIFNMLVMLLSVMSSNLWRSIIALTIIIRLVLLRTTTAGNAMQQQMTDIQPKLKEIQEKYKDNPEKLSQETMSLLKTQGAWPLKWCLGMIIQLPVFISLLNVVQSIAKSNGVINYDDLYSFLQPLAGHVSSLQSQFLGMDLLSSTATIWHISLVVICAILVFAQSQLMALNKPALPVALPTDTPMPDMTKMMGMMNYLLPIMMASFVRSVQSGVGLYILTTTAFSVIQFGRQYRALLQAKWIGLIHRTK